MIQKKLFTIFQNNLTEVEKSVLCKGLQFALPPRNLEYADYMVSFELLFRDIATTNLGNIQNP